MAFPAPPTWAHWGSTLCIHVVTTMCPAILPVTLLSLPAAVLPAPPKPPLLQAGPSQPSGLCPFASSSREPALVSPSPCVLHGTQSRCLGSVSRTSRGESLAVGAEAPGEGRGVPAWPISERLSPVTPGQHAHAVECRVACTRSGRPLCPGSCFAELKVSRMVVREAGHLNMQAS